MNGQVRNLQTLSEQASAEVKFRSSTASTNTIAVIRRRRRTYWAGCDGV